MGDQPGITGATENPPAVEVYPAMSIVAIWIMLPLGCLAIVSGLPHAWTRNAKFRLDWVRVRLLVTLTLAVALVVVVATGLADEAARAHAGATGGNPAYGVGPAVSATLLVVNVVLGTVKATRLFRRGLVSRARSRSLEGASRLMTKPNSHGGHEYLPDFSHDALLPWYDVVQRLTGIPALHRRLVDRGSRWRHRRHSRPGPSRNHRCDLDRMISDGPFSQTKQRLSEFTAAPLRSEQICVRIRYAGFRSEPVRQKQIAEKSIRRSRLS